MDQLSASWSQLNLEVSLLFHISQERKAVEGAAVQDPKVCGAQPPENLFRAQNSSQAHGCHSACLCGN